MCRRTITYLRTTRLATLVPFDDSTRLHRAMAYVICAATVVHGGGQAFNYCMYYYALERWSVWEHTGAAPAHSSAPARAFAAAPPRVHCVRHRNMCSCVCVFECRCFGRASSLRCCYRSLY